MEDTATESEIRPRTVPLDNLHSGLTTNGISGNAPLNNAESAQLFGRQHRRHSKFGILELARQSIELPVAGTGRNTLTPICLRKPTPEKPPLWPPSFVEEPCFISKSIVKKDGVSRLDMRRWSMLQAQSHPLIQDSASSKARVLSHSISHVGLKSLLLCMQLACACCCVLTPSSRLLSYLGTPLISSHTSMPFKTASSCMSDSWSHWI